MLGLFCAEPAVGSQYIISIPLAMLTICQSAGYHLVFECAHASNRNIAGRCRMIASSNPATESVLPHKLIVGDSTAPPGSESANSGGAQISNSPPMADSQSVRHCA